MNNKFQAIAGLNGMQLGDKQLVVQLACQKERAAYQNYANHGASAIAGEEIAYFEKKNRAPCGKVAFFEKKMTLIKIVWCYLLKLRQK